MDFDVESLQQQIPSYLTSQDQEVLVRELRAIAKGGTANYFLSDYQDSFQDSMLQGDGWRGFQLFLFDTGERRSVRGLVLSNSCDVDPANPRDYPTRVSFAPLVKLSAYKTYLDASGISADRVAAKLASIRTQRTTNTFFLPADGPLSEEYVVRFDEIQSMPAKAHRESTDCEKLFTLSNTGFYMLVLKLSIHFCRLQENVHRNPASRISS